MNGYGDRSICHDIVRQYGAPLLDSLSRYVLSKDRWCNEILHVCTHVDVVKHDLHDVVNRILATKPASLASDDFNDRLYDEIAADTSGQRKVIRAVHISDVHLDLQYEVGTNAVCDSLLCCRAEFGIAEPGQPAAGPWGSDSGLCDLPLQTFQHMMAYVASDIQPDVVFWTGDNSAHTVWNNTVEEVTNYTKVVTNTIKDAFKDSNVSVYPIMGNHDTWPTDIQDFSAPGINYPINHIKEDWSDWLDEAATEKFGEYGHYSMDLSLKNGKELPAGSKVIALNTNSCDMNNWYILGERSDPGHQFAWLEQQLLDVEA